MKQRTCNVPWMIASRPGLVDIACSGRLSTTAALAQASSTCSPSIHVERLSCRTRYVYSFCSVFNGDFDANVTQLQFMRSFGGGHACTKHAAAISITLQYDTSYWYIFVTQPRLKYTCQLSAMRVRSGVHSRVSYLVRSGRNTQRRKQGDILSLSFVCLTSSGPANLNTSGGGVM